MAAEDDRYYVSTLDDLIATRSEEEQKRAGSVDIQQLQHQYSSGPADSNRPQRPRSSPPNQADPDNLVLAVKMLITHSQAGALIGSQGSAVKELIQTSTARVYVSEYNYPGTALRTVYITGSEEAVGHAATLVVELIAQEELARARPDEPWTWTPRVVQSGPGGRTSNMDVEVTITVPSSSAGLLLGKGGTTKRAIEEESGVLLTMSDKASPSSDVTHERLITIAGKTLACSYAISMVLDKLNSDLENCQFVVRGTTFGQGVKSMLMHSSTLGGGARRGGGREGGRDGGRDRRSDPWHDSRNAGGGSPGYPNDEGRRARGVQGSEYVRELSSATVIELAIPDARIGAILGPGGSKLREIMGIARAQVNVSHRGDYMEGTRNRRVTIEGAPSCVKAAKDMILHIVSTGTDEPRDVRHN